MPQPQEKTPDSVSTLPNPELNPLLNPTLGRNLGRWAQAYFTSAPEKREQAVTELLRELEAEAETSGASPFEPDATPGWLHRVEEAQLVAQTIICVECGHQNAAQQRFCGMCGSFLSFDENTTHAEREHDAVAGGNPPVESAETAVLADPAFGTLSLFASVDRAPVAERAVETSSLSSTPSEIQWLRDKDLRAPLSSAPQGSAAKYVVVGLGVLLLGVLFYAQSRTERTRPPTTISSSGPSRPLTPQPPTPAPAASEPASQSGNTAANTSIQTLKPETAAQASERRGANPSAIRQASPTPDAAATSSVRNAVAVQVEGTSPVAGSAELATAEDFLTGKYGRRDSTEAAKFLWRAVGKENTSAILLLSDLYLAGDGVPKSCDQARLLLNAAARKNVAQAADKLRHLRRSGCP